MGGGGKGGTTTSSQTVSIPPEVLARYNAVNARAETTAEQPFQQYGGEFVAPLTPTQVAGTQATNAAAGQAQPYYGAATALTLGGAKNVGPLTQGQIGYYQNPYTQAVVNPTVQALQQQQGQQLAEQQAQAIKGGAFGGDRANLQRSQLQGQQNLALGQAIAPLYQQGYGQAVQTAQTQQGVVASDLARQMQAGQQVAGLGTGAQQAALQGAQAQLAAGQVGQQTQQAQDTAQYQQFLQERGYPFQVAQFLANIAMGTGALSGSTTSGTQTAPGGFFSDKRLKNDVKEIGETHDGQPIYSYKYNGDNRTQIGLMAQDVEKKHPDAVGLMGGYKTVDYKKATEGAERTHKDVGGGLMPQMLTPEMEAGDTTPSVEMSGMTPENAAAAYNSSSPNPTSGWGPRQDTSVALRGSWRDLPASRLTNTPDDRNSSSSAAMWSAPGARYGRAMGGGLVPDGFDPNSMGGAVSPDMAGEGFERGGYVGGGLVDANDWASIVAANKQALGMYGGAQPMGGPVGATGIVPAATIHVPKPIEAAKMSMPAQRPSGMSTAMQTGKDIAGAYSMGKAGLIGSAKTAADPEGSAGLIGGQGEWGGKNLFSKAKELFAADGGFIVPRHAYADGGGDDSQGDEAVPYDPSDVMGSKDPMEGVLKAGSQKHELLKPAQMQTSGGGGGGSSLGLGKMAGSVIGSAFGPLGSMAGGVLGGLLPFAGGGLVPRQGYALQGATDVPADYSPEADMPSPNAQEAARYSEEDLDRAARDALALQMRRESGGDSQAKAKTSSAAGMYQITNPTAKGLIARNPQWGIEYQDVPHFAATLSPEQQQTLGLGLSKEHIRTLANQGFEPTPQNVSANWFLGGGGGPAFLKAMQTDPSMPATSAAGQDQIRANPTMFFKQDGSPRSVSEVYSMLNKTGGGAPVPPGLVGAGMQPASTSGAGEKKGLVDTVTSEGFIVPALGFLGSMLASNRPNLGQALGEGIMGGVGAYQGQQKQLADIAKTKAETSQMLPVATARNIEAANKLATGLMQYNASLPPGSPKLTLQQYAKIVGYEGPLPSVAEQAASTATKESKPVGAAPGEVKVAEPASRNWSFSPDEKETLVINYPDGTVVPASKDPLYLSKYADRYTTMGEGWAKEQAEAARKSAEEIVRSGKTVDVNGNVVALPGAIESGQKQKIGEGLAKEALEFNDAAQKYRSEAKNILGVLDDLGKNYSVLRSGPDSAARANFDRMVKLIDPDNKFPNLHPDESWSAGRYDKAVKDAFQLSIAQLTALSPRAPKAELDTLARTIPLPNLDASAIQDLIGDAKARVEWNMKLHDAFDVNRDLDLNKFKKKFEDDTPFDKFKAEVKKTIPAAAGTQQQREQAAVPQFSEAMQWAKSNPDDPRSAEILKRLGVK